MAIKFIYLIIQKSYNILIAGNSLRTLGYFYVIDSLSIDFFRKKCYYIFVEQLNNYNLWQDTHTIGSCVFIFRVTNILSQGYVKLFHKQCENDACYMCHLAKGGTFFMDTSCCFIGHRKIENKETIKPLLKQEIVRLLDKGVTKFFFGSMSEFDDLSWEVVTELKNEYPSIRRIYVRSAYQYIDKSYEDYLLESYEETYYPPKIENAGKCSYVERNYEMIDKSAYCIFYYNENYLPELKREPKHNMLPPSRRKSGTKIAYEYALKKKKEIINIYG